MSLVTTAPSYVTGQVVTAAQLNALQDGIQAAWTAYTPAWTGSVTNPVIGNGTITGDYLQVGKDVKFWAKVIAGSTTTFGSGSYSISLPVAPLATFAAPLLCRYKVGANIYAGMTYQYTGSAAALAVDNSTAGGVLQAVTTTVPGTFASASEIHVIGTYEAA